MKPFFILIISLSFSLIAFGQADSLARPDDSVGRGFTNKAEAKNLMVNGLKEGKWVEYVNASDLGLGLFEDNDSVYKLTVYKRGYSFGIVRIYKLDGKLWCEIPCQNGKENGLEKEYGKTGKICILEIPWEDGKISGKMKEYYESGKLQREAPYSDNEANGIAKEYYESGKLKEETTYINGFISVRKFYDKNGNEIK